MFTKIGVRKICSDSGFCVEIPGRTFIVYTEVDLEVKIDGEMILGPAGYLIYKDSLEASRLGRGVKLIESEAVRILENVRQAFAFDGAKIDII